MYCDYFLDFLPPQHWKQQFSNSSLWCLQHRKDLQ